MTLNAIPVGIAYTLCNIIFMPIKERIIAKACPKYLNLSNIFSKTKYSERSPSNAKIFVDKTKKGSGVIANMAGIESKAKNKSVIAMTVMTINIGVTSLPDLSFINNLKSW